MGLWSELRRRHVYRMHFGTFDLSDEPLDEPPLRYKGAARDSEFADESAWVLAIGEPRTF